jgi:hypothetical protein
MALTKIGNVLGPKGDKGDIPKINIGEVYSGPNIDVEAITDENGDVTLNFVLQQGPKGNTGNGVLSVVGTKVDGGTNITFNMTDPETTKTFKILDGLDGNGVLSVVGTKVDGGTNITFNMTDPETTKTFKILDGLDGNGILNLGKLSESPTSDTNTVLNSLNKAGTYQFTFNDTVYLMRMSTLESTREDEGTLWVQVIDFETLSTSPLNDSDGHMIGKETQYTHERIVRRRNIRYLGQNETDPIGVIDIIIT